MPPPMAMPRSTRGRRVRNKISALGSGENIFSKARTKSRGTGPSREQPSADRIKSRKRHPLTRIIFLRFRTFTSTLPVAFVVRRVREAFRMNEACKLRQGLADPRSRAQNFVGWVGIDPSVGYRGNRFEIAPTVPGLLSLRPHARFDNDLRRLGHYVLFGQIEPGLRGASSDVFPPSQSNQFVDKISSAHYNQRTNADRQQHAPTRRGGNSFLDRLNIGIDLTHQVFPRLRASHQAGDGFDPSQDVV